VEFARDSFDLGNIGREGYRENWRNYEGENRTLKKGKKNS